METKFIDYRCLDLRSARSRLRASGFGIAAFGHRGIEYRVSTFGYRATNVGSQDFGLKKGHTVVSHDDDFLQLPALGLRASGFGLQLSGIRFRGGVRVPSSHTTTYFSDPSDCPFSGFGLQSSGIRFRGGVRCRGRDLGWCVGCRV